MRDNGRINFFIVLLESVFPNILYPAMAKLLDHFHPIIEKVAWIFECLDSQLSFWAEIFPKNSSYLVKYVTFNKGCHLVHKIIGYE